MASGVNPDMVEAVRLHIYDALARTGEHSTLPEEEQDGLLAQACAEACDVLGGWVKSPDWARLRASGQGVIADVIPDLKRVRPFLEPLKETLNRISSRQKNAPDIGDPAEYFDKVIAEAEHTGRRYRRLQQRALFDDATKRIESLKKSVCELASEFASDLKTGAADREKRAKRRSRARSVLAKIPGVLLAVSLAMASAGPGAMRENIPEWGHDVVNVLLVHHVAQTAQPGARIAPPHAGPRVG